MSRESLTRFIENLYEEIHKSAEYRRHTANLRTHHFIWSKTDFQVRISKDLQARGLILTAADNTKISKECDILSNEIISAIQNIRSERDSLAEKLELSAGKIDYAFTSMTNTGRKPTRWASADDVFANLKEVYKEAIGIFFNNMQTYFQSMQESPEETALRVANREGNTKGKSSKRGIRTKGKGKLIKTAGRFINAEHEDNAGILESLIRDAFKKTSAEVVDSQGNSISEAQLQKDLKALGIKIQMRRDENDNHVITLGGSLINIQKGNQAKEVNADLKKALERAHAHLAKNMGGLQHLEGSDTPLQKRKKRLTATAIEPFKKKKNVNIKVTHEDIKVNKAKYVIYFLFDFNPSASISFLIALLISKKIKIKRNESKTIFKINKYCKFWLESSMGLLSIKVKKVKKPTDNVIINRNIKYMFFLIKSYILK